MRYILFSIGSLHIYSYGLMIAIGVICAFLYQIRELTSMVLTAMLYSDLA